MGISIGIRHEDKYKMERRAPLTPMHIEKLLEKYDLDFVVQSSPKRVFSDSEYQQAGCTIADNLKNCNLIFGVKEIPEAFFEKEKVYVFFSHVIKGQSYNMPMLKRMMELKCSLIDYERIVDDQNKRLIFFGKYAGLAGMINTLWSIGQRLKQFGYTNNPFDSLKQAHHYDSLEEAKQHISKVGKEIANHGLPKELLPFTIGFTGYGNVSQGAQEIANLLPSQEITPEQLLELKEKNEVPDNVVFKVIFKEKHLSRRIDGAAFDLQDYYGHPEKYENDFEQYIPSLSVLMNCMYWDSRYPRIVTKDYIKMLSTQGNLKMIAIGDVTCDPDGSIEFTHKGTEIEDPVFVFDPQKGKPAMGFKGDGILVMAVDILPSELPRDSSVSFGDALAGFVNPVAMADFNKPYEELDLPGAIKKALILHKGELTAEYKYIEKFL